MEVGESVAVLFGRVVKGDLKCDKEPETEDWKSKINDWGTVTGCSGTALYNNMKEPNAAANGYLGPPQAFIAKPAPHTKWKLSDVSTEQFPVQAHHIIPKNHLPDHAVCAFLAKKYTKHEKYQLTADAPYSTDHANNGYCLPYATPLAEWKELGSGADAEPYKLNICFDVMKQTGRQLHQGSHRAAPYDSVPDDEEAGIHTDGYLTAINLLLDVVQEGAQEHAPTCEICNKGQSEGGKTKLLPRDAVVRHMDQVSGIVKLLIDANREFISEPAALFGKAKHMEIPGWLAGSGA